MKRYLILIISFLFLWTPSLSFAVTGSELIPSWVDPAQSTSYGFITPVELKGTWQLPPQWAGFIEVYMDATIDPMTKVPLTIGTLMSDVSTGKTAFVVNNGATSSATTTGNFLINIGTQMNGDHNIYIKFWGGTECAVNRALNEINANGISNRIPDCSKTADNFAPGIVWPAREFSVSLPNWPRMVITPSSTPALNFSNIVLGSLPTQDFKISNTGNSTLTGSLAVTPPFYCSSCSYTINPGGLKTISVSFSPTTSPASYSISASFSCIGSGSKGCDGGPDNVLAYQNFNIIGNSVNNAVVPVLSINPSTLINYGQVNLGMTYDRTIRVSNTGGGLLNGDLKFFTPEYTCPYNPTCSYSLFAGGPPLDIVIRYIPTLVGAHNDTGSFTGGTGGTITLQSVVNDLPIVSLYNGTGDTQSFYVDFGKVNVGGSCPPKRVYFRNSGAGILTGIITGMPFDLGGSAKIPGFSCISSACASYGSLVNTGAWTSGYSYADFQFCPSGAGYADAWATFNNSLNPMASGTLHLYGNGNVLPVGSASGLSIVFPNTLINTTITRTITISNTGVGILTGNIAPATLFPSVYKCVSTGVHGDSSCKFNVPAGSSTVITFSFTPSAVQSYAGSKMNIPGVGDVVFSGSGVQPRFQMSYLGYPDLAPTPAYSILPPSPKSYDVGTTVFGGLLTVQNKRFYLYAKNTGSGSSLNYTFHNAAHFVCLGGVTYGCSGSFPPGAKETIVYEFRPDAATSFSESVVVDYDYGDGNLQSMQLDVTGDSVSAPYLSVSPNTLVNLGNVAVGATATTTFTVSNLGIGTLSGTVTFPSTAATDPTTGLIHRWTFDTADINWTTHAVVDTAGGGSTAYIPGPISAIGKYGEALNFIGAGGVSRPSPLLGFLNGNALHTTMMWLKPTSLTASRAWIALLGQPGGGSEHFLQNSGGSTQFGVWSGGQTFPTLPVGKWTHIALVHDGATLRSYVDGVLSQSVAATYNFTSTPLYLGLGKLLNGESDYNGLVDDLRIYNRALSATEIVQAASNTAPVSSGLLARWTFDDPTVVWSQMKVLDSSGKGNDGNLISIPTTVPGKLKEALLFNGSSANFVNVPNTANLSPGSGSMTMSLWFKANSASANILYNKEDLYEAMVSGGYFIYAWQPHWNWDGDTSFPVTPGVWYHAVVVYDGSNQYLYKDGALVYSRPQTGSMGSNGNRLAFGTRGYAGGGESPFNGSIDDVRMYNRALSAAEVANLYQANVSAGLAAFSCVSGCTFGPLATNDSASVKIEFSPTDAIGYIGNPLFSSNGGNIGYPALPYPSITGTGVLNPLIDVSPMTLSFPLTNLGLSSKKYLVITNNGLGDLVGNVSPVKSATIAFYCLANCNYNLPPGASTTATIEFSPNATGTLSSMIKLTSNAINTQGGIVNIPAFGDGKFAPIIDPRGGDTNYGKVIISKHKSQTFTIDNTNSTADLGSGTFVVTGPYKCTASADGFDALGNCNYNLPAGGIAIVTITFSPTAVGGLPATSINTGSVWLSGVPLARFFVQGIGVAPTVKFIEE